jgi:hypothetical protein
LSISVARRYAQDCRVHTNPAVPAPARPRRWLIALALAPLGVPASAHHSFAMFDPSKPMKFEATVQSLQ